MGRTLFEKVWDDHVVHDFGGGDYLLRVDRNWLNDNAYHALADLDRRGLDVHNPELTFAVVDHLIDTKPGRTYVSRIPVAEEWALGTKEGCRKHGIRFFDLDDPRHGIAHVISPEMGLTLPGTLLVCTDSHTCTNGAFGAYACGVGSFGSTHVLATQTLIQRRPRSMRVFFTGTPDASATPKDLVLHMIGSYGVTGALGHAVEYAGPVIERMSMEGRMTMCNMGVEFGGSTAMVAPDATTYAFLEGREFAPQGEAWERAVAYWDTLRSDDDASFDTELVVDCEGLEPQVTWGTSPGQVTSISGVVPDPAAAEDDGRRRSGERALEYMGLEAGQRLEGLPIHAAFLGSCTNARLDDLRAAAEFLRGKHVADGVRATCVPGSASVKRAAEAEGLDEVFVDAGFLWGEAGCSLCNSAVADLPEPGQRIISSTNRTSEGRQGPGVRAHLASPVTVAASAVAGVITDVRKVA
jgi:3-isopropylmalate/(R)-2-methylmalate dehydratase large subunit